MTIQYNGYTFGTFSHLTIEAQQAWDDAQLTVKYVRYLMTVQSIVVADGTQGDSNANDHFERVREKLSAPCKVLNISNVGFGDALAINDTTLDVNHGPKPRILSWIPVGNNNAVEFIWQCEFTIPECATASTTGLCAFNYSIDWSINQRGFTTRTIAGYLEIMLTRNASGDALADTADNYRNQISIDQPDNFERQQDYRLSEDRKRLDFTIIDSEIESPNARPVGVVDIDARHRAAKNRRDFAQTNHALRVSIELAQNQPRLLAWEVFRLIYARVVSLITNGTIIFESLEIDEPIFGNRYEFSSEFRVMKGGIKEMVVNQALFQLMQFSWSGWQASMINVTDDRGLAGMEHRTTDDKIVDPCSPSIRSIDHHSSTTTVPPNNAYVTLSNTLPDPADSYIHFESSLQEETEYRKGVGYELGPVDVEKNDFDASQSDASLNQIQFYNLETTLSEAVPGMRFRWRGYAERLGYPIPTPDLSDFAGVELQKIGKSKFAQRNRGDMYGQDVYVAAWDFLYVVLERPTEHDTRDHNPNESADV